MTHYSVYLTSSAIADLTLAKEYYNSKIDGLGKRMSNEVDIILNKISATPKVYSKRYREIRAAKIPSFPYLIYFRIVEKKQINTGVESV